MYHGKLAITLSSKSTIDMELILVGAFLDVKLRKTIRANSHLCSMLFFMLSNGKSIFHLFSITSFKPLLLAPQ
jgi:hypothetical protein